MTASAMLQKEPVVRLYRGDCLDVLRRLEDGSIDSVITDPPYGISYRNKRAKVLQRPIANDERPFVWWMWDAARVMREGGALLCFCRWDVQEPFRVAIDLAGLKVRGQLVWDRMVHGQGDVRSTAGPRHDVMWFATKGAYRFPGGRPQSLIAAPNIPGIKRMHPTEKPADLMRKLVALFTPPGGTVLDPCMGSGATAEACRDGFGFVGIEIDEAYYARARARVRRVIQERRTRGTKAANPSDGRPGPDGRAEDQPRREGVCEPDISADRGGDRRRRQRRSGLEKTRPEPL